MISSKQHIFIKCQFKGIKIDVHLAPVLYLSLHLVAWWSFIFNWEKSSFQTFISLYFCVSLAVSLPRTFSTLTHNGTIGINHHAYLRNIVSLSVQCVSLGLLCKIWQNPVNDPCEPSDTIPDTEEITKKLTNHPRYIAWWRHQMEKLSALLALCAGNSPITGELPSQRPVTRSFDAFFDLRLNKRLNKHSTCWWFETP